MGYITEEYKKSTMTASDSYDFTKLEAAGEHFLTLTWEEKEENVVFNYQADRMSELINIRDEDYIVVLNILIRIADFSKDVLDYQFSLAPDNIYFNSNGRVCIKKRDIYEHGDPNTGEPFIREYKALIAWTLSDKYSYPDYSEAGEELYKNSEITAPLYNILSVDEATAYLEQIKEKYMEERSRRKVFVSRRADIMRKILLVIFAVGTVVFGTYSAVMFFGNVPHYERLNEANNAYIENDRTALIDALAEVDLEEMEIQQKYILSRAYVQSENLTNMQKENILDKLLLSTNEKVMDFWICIGRLDIANAKDIAMQLSDDELLLYSYMSEKEQLEVDRTITGAKKEQRLQEIQEKIDSLAGIYEIDDENPDGGNTTYDDEKGDDSDE